MYQYTIKIDIYSNDSNLITEIEKVSPLKNFDHKFQFFSSLTLKDSHDCDIIIFNLPFDANLINISKTCKADTCFIYCSDFSDINEIPFEMFEDIWHTPLSTEVLKYNFKKLLSLIKLKKDYKLNQQCLDTTINSIPDLVWFKDIRGSHLKVNDAFCSAVGKTKQDVEGRGHYYIWDLKQEDYEKGEYVCLETEEIVIKEQKTCLFDEMVKSKNGLRQFKTYKSPIFNEQNQVIGTVGIAHDVTDLENMLTELEIVLRSMPFAILVKNNEGNIINSNGKFENYFNIKSQDILGVNYNILKNKILKNVTFLIKEGFAEGTINHNGEELILEIHEVQIYDVFSDVVGELCIYRDVTTERTLEQKIITNSNTDFMTGLYNRRYFYEYINKERGNKSVNLIYIDLDNFKKINDTYGHQAGDDGLICTAKILVRCFPEAFITRLGGDEFLVTLMGEYSIEILENMSNQLLLEMHKTFTASEQLKILSASIGISKTNDSNMHIDTLIKQSDIALYEAKLRGRSCFCTYSPDLERNL